MSSDGNETTDEVRPCGADRGFMVVLVDVFRPLPPTAFLEPLELLFAVVGED